MVRLFIATAISAAAMALAGPGLATDRVEARISASSPQPAEYGSGTETISVVILAGADELWSGTLRIGPQYGNASFSMSKNESAEPCPGEISTGSERSSSSFSLNFNLNRHNWQQERDRFNVNVNWSQPLPACRGAGTDTLGFTRIVEVPPGRTVSITGPGGLAVRLTRQP